mgnify:CR=1 FL=1
MGTVEGCDAAEQLAPKARNGGSPSVKNAACKVAQGVTRGDVHGQEKGFEAHDEGADADAPPLGCSFSEVQCVSDIPPFDG